MKQPKLGEFTLKKVKRMNGGGLSVEWTVTEDAGSSVFIDSFSKDCTHEPTTSLHTKLNEFKEALCKVWKYETDEEKKTAKVNGVALSGNEEKLGIIIMGVMRTHTEKNVAMNTERIILKNNFYGFEEDLRATIEDLNKEVFEYLYMEKYEKASDLFNQEPKTKKKGKKKGEGVVEEEEAAE